MKRARPTNKADETPEFQAFWAIWQPHMHKNDGRGSARDEFFRHVDERGADPQDIVDGAAWFIRDGGQQEVGYDGKLIKCHAQTWLNRCAFLWNREWQSAQRTIRSLANSFPRREYVL